MSVPTDAKRSPFLAAAGTDAAVQLAAGFGPLEAVQTQTTPMPGEPISSG